jgi:hypothetical protein
MVKAKAEALEDLWNAQCEIWRKRGVDLPVALKQWATQQESLLASPGARTDFEELHANGCVPELLAILVAFLRWSPTFEDFWSKVYGGSEDRRRLSKSLEKTARRFERLFLFSIQLEDKIPILKFEKLGRINPARLVSELRMYARMLDFIDRLPRETQTRSLADFGKFSLTEYVKQATGRFRDRNVSALVAEAIGSPDYNEVAHRMWRSRNFKRMNSHFEKLSELLSEIHILATART